MWIAQFIDWIVCVIIKCHDWQLIEEYKPMMRAKIFTGDGFEEKEIPNPFKKEKISGKWRCRRCGQVTIGSIANARQ